MEEMARFSRLLLWKLLLSLYQESTSLFYHHLGSTTDVCADIRSALSPSPFFSCGTDALQAPFDSKSSGSSLRTLRFGTFRRRPPRPAVSPPPPSLPGAEEAISALALQLQPTVLADNNGDPLAAEQRQEDMPETADVVSGDITGMPSPPPVLDVDLEDGKADKQEQQASGSGEKVDLTSGPAQTPEPVAAAPSPFIPPRGPAPFASFRAEAPPVPHEKELAGTPTGVSSVIVVNHYFPKGIPIIIMHRNPTGAIVTTSEFGPA